MRTPAHFFTSDGARIAYTLSGPKDAKPVVLCDGFGCDGYIWRYLRPSLSRHYRVIGWHYRGHGRSAPPISEADFGVERMSRDLAALLSAQQAEGAVLLGHSLGVQVILQAALDFPERLRGIVPICGCYGDPLRTLRRRGRAEPLFALAHQALQRHPAAGRWLWRRTLRSRGMRLWTRYIEVNRERLDMADMEDYFAHLAGMDPTLFMRMLAGVQHHSVAHRLHEVRLPTLVIGAQRDTFTPMNLSRHMQQQIPGASLLEISAGSHVAPLEFPALVEARIAAFLREILLPA